MKLIVQKEIFEKVPTLCIGVVMAHGIDNTKDYLEINDLLNRSIQDATLKYSSKRIKEESEILPYREAFRALNMNPNKYLCSIEALLTRISKGKIMPHINPIVDLGNALSLKYSLPMGAHDVSEIEEDIYLRFSEPNDIFVPMGLDVEERVDLDEAIYAINHQVRTRRWTWRQSECGKITSNSRDIFFPIDGFTDFNKDRVLAAQNELETKLKTIFKCQTKTGFVDVNHTEMNLLF